MAPVLGTPKASLEAACRPYTSPWAHRNSRQTPRGLPSPSALPKVAGARNARNANAQEKEEEPCSDWSIDAAFGDAIKRAEKEGQLDGVNIFAAAPKLTFQGTAPGLQAPHGRCSGFVLPDEDTHRLDGCLTKDYFQRPAWNKSTFAPKAKEEDPRSLETMARDDRAEIISSSLADMKRRESIIAAVSESRRGSVVADSRRGSLIERRNSRLGEDGIQRRLSGELISESRRASDSRPSTTSGMQTVRRSITGETKGLFPFAPLVPHTPGNNGRI